MVHSTAIIHPKARLGAGVKVGPYAVIEEDVLVGDGCEIGPHVYLTGVVELGTNNRLHAGCVIGDLPQDLRFRGGNTRVVIGNDNVIREHVTVHRSNKLEEPTRIGSGNLLMAHCHLGHNTVLGNQIIIANGALLAGHVTVQDGVFISGHCLVHQFVRIGALALMQGGSGLSKDLPPFTIASGINTIAGLNTIGLRRAGVASEDRLELRRLYQRVFRSGGKFQAAVAQAQAEFSSPRSKQLLEFLAEGKRGFCADAGSTRPTEINEEL